MDGVPIVETVNHGPGPQAGAAMILDAAPGLTAVVTMCDVLALAVIDEAARRGLRVPEDLSVVGFDDIPEAAAARPPLTTIAQPIREKGRLAAEMIFAGGPPRKEVLPVALVTRASTAPPRC